MLYVVGGGVSCDKNVTGWRGVMGCGGVVMGCGGILW